MYSEKQIIDALKMAYRKHQFDDDSIGWNELSATLCDALCEMVGDAEFQEFVKQHAPLNTGKGTEQ